MFKELDVDVLTRWRQAHNMLLDSEQWQNDPELQKLPTLDILLAFEDYSRVREREYEEQMRRAQVEKTRRERKAREGFKVPLYFWRLVYCSYIALGTTSFFDSGGQDSRQDEMEGCLS